MAQSVAFSRAPFGMVNLRHAQHVCRADLLTRLDIARKFVALKVGSQLRLQRDLGLRPARPEAALIKGLEAAGDASSLRGVEGAFASEHFEALAKALPANWGFKHRNRRPPRDPFNALLSLGYTLAQEESSRLALRVGLDLEVGFLHDLRSRRQSLALDLVEPARAAVESWLLRMIEAKAIAPADFQDNAADGCRLSKAGRHVLYANWFAHGQQASRTAARPGLAMLLGVLRKHLDRKRLEKLGSEDEAD